MYMQYLSKEWAHTFALLILLTVIDYVCVYVCMYLSIYLRSLWWDLARDREYASRQFFMTPFPDPGPQTCYNASWARTRAKIKMPFEQLKGRCQCFVVWGQHLTAYMTSQWHTVCDIILLPFEKKGPLQWRSSLMMTLNQCTLTYPVVGLQETGLWPSILDKCKLISCGIFPLLQRWCALLCWHFVSWKKTLTTCSK